MPATAIAALYKTPRPAPLPLATIDIMGLIDEHDRIDALSAKIVAQSSAANPDVAATIATLADLAFLVTVHLRNEDMSIYPMLLDGLPIPGSKESGDAIADFMALRADWTAFLGEWTADCVEADFDGFREEAATMLDRLRARVHWETSLLYPYALRRGVIRLRPATVAAS